MAIEAKKFVEGNLGTEEFMDLMEQELIPLPDSMRSDFSSYFTFPTSSNREAIREFFNSPSSDEYLKKLHSRIDDSTLTLYRGVGGKTKDEFEQHDDGQIISLSESPQEAEKFANLDRKQRVGLLLRCEIAVETVVYHWRYVSPQSDEFEIISHWDSSKNNCEVVRAPGDADITEHDVKKIDAGDIKSDPHKDHREEGERMGSNPVSFRVSGRKLNLRQIMGDLEILVEDEFASLYDTGGVGRGGGTRLTGYEVDENLSDEQKALFVVNKFIDEKT